MGIGSVFNVRSKGYKGCSSSLWKWKWNKILGLALILRHQEYGNIPQEHNEFWYGRQREEMGRWSVHLFSYSSKCKPDSVIFSSMAQYFLVNWNAKSNCNLLICVFSWTVCFWKKTKMRIVLTTLFLFQNTYEIIRIKLFQLCSFSFIYLFFKI